jgi:hypothetical protein
MAATGQVRLAVDTPPYQGIPYDPIKCSPPVLQALLQPLYDQAIGGEQAPIRWMESWLGRISPRQALAKNAGV